jgi:hypothetical protein
VDDPLALADRERVNLADGEVPHDDRPELGPEASTVPNEPSNR